MGLESGGASLEVGTINDAARRYRVDGATIWYWITSRKVLELGGRRVVLTADEKYPNGRTWKVMETYVRGDGQTSLHGN